MFLSGRRFDLRLGLIALGGMFVLRRRALRA
jgi:hypothetical protein